MLKFTNDALSMSWTTRHALLSRQTEKDRPECFLPALLPPERIIDAKPNALDSEALGIAELLRESLRAP